MPTQFDYQNTDRENSKPTPKSVSRDNDLSTRSLGSSQSIARVSNSGQQNITGSGATAVTSNVK